MPLKNIQPHIKCKKGDVAKYVLLPGDPGRIKGIVKYWDKAKKIAYNREFLTYTGEYKGVPVSATSTGVGCPSAAIAVEELANIGAEIFIRIGTCGALKREIKPGDVIIPTAAIRAEGTTKEYVPAELPAVADSKIVYALEKAAQKVNGKYFKGLNRTHDAFYEPVENFLRWGKLYQDKRMADWQIPLVSSEMECSAIFLIAMLRGLKAGAILSVNTTEALDEVIKNPALVYKLTESPNVKKGIDREIKIALEAVRILEGVSDL